MSGLRIFHLVIFVIYTFCFFSNGQTKIEKNTDINNKYFGKLSGVIKVPNNSRIKIVLASDNEPELYVTNEEGGLFSYNSENYTQIWTTELGGRTSSNLLALDDKLFLLTSRTSDSEMTASDSTASGSTFWGIDKITGITFARKIVSDAGRFYLYAFNKEIIYVNQNSCISIYDSELNQKSNIPCVEKKLFGSPILDAKNAELILVYEDSIGIVRLGEDLSVFDKKVTRKNSISKVIFSDNMYFVGDESGKLSAFDRRSSEKIWSFRAGGKISDMELIDNKLFVSSYDNFLYCLKSDDGERTWKRRFSGRISDIQTISDGGLLIKTSSSDDLIVVDFADGSVLDRLISFEIATDQIDIIKLPRLIIKQNLYSIDFYCLN